LSFEMSINVKSIFDLMESLIWLWELNGGCYIILILKLMKICPNLWSLWNHLFKKHAKIHVCHYHTQLVQNVESCKLYIRGWIIENLFHIETLCVLIFYSKHILAL
jgi:hypothetical protein